MDIGVMSIAIMLMAIVIGALAVLLVFMLKSARKSMKKAREVRLTGIICLIICVGALAFSVVSIMRTQVSVKSDSYDGVYDLNANTFDGKIYGGLSSRGIGANMFRT